jgi:5-oxoprolinase (ATP-hydrolysing) subunit B
MGGKRRAHLAGQSQCVKGRERILRLPYLIASALINLLKLLHHFAQGEFHFSSKHASLIHDESANTMPENLSPPRLLLSGDSAITVEFSRTIDDAANRRVLALDRIITAEPIEGVTETVPTYRSLLVHYDPVQVGFDGLGEQLLARATKALPTAAGTRRWRIPVAYGGEHGIDLEDVAKALKTTPDDIVARHVAGDYRVAMIGFTPGWSYLSGLESFLHMPRRKDPRLLTPAGTISIGGVQTGVQCLAGPSGWHLLGRTPVRTYQLHREPIFLLEPGDAITFAAVDAKTFAEQDRAAEAGEFVAELVTP